MVLHVICLAIEYECYQIRIVCSLNNSTLEYNLTNLKINVWMWKSIYFVTREKILLTRPERKKGCKSIYYHYIYTVYIDTTHTHTHNIIIFGMDFECTELNIYKIFHLRQNTLDDVLLALCLLLSFLILFFSHRGWHHRIYFRPVCQFQPK